jgi:SAM-dependent methyltransferase
MNNLQNTQETYRQIAAAYAQAQQDRAPLARQTARFVALVKPGGLVFDVGCGPGLDTAVLQQHNLQAIGLDFTHEMMQVGRQEYGIELPFVQADMRHLPLAPVADGLWVCASLLHLERADVLPTVQAFHRVLKPGGILYLSVKLGEGEEWVTSAYGQPFGRFFAYWQPETLDTLLETAGFKIVDEWQESGGKDTWLVRYALKIEVV